MNVKLSPEEVVSMGREELLSVLDMDEETFELMDLDDPVMLHGLVNELFGEAVRDVSMKEFESDPNEGMPDEE